MQLTYVHPYFELRPSRDDLALGAAEEYHQRGFRFHPNLKRWYAPTPGIALAYKAEADAVAQRRIRQLWITNRPWTGAIPFPAQLTPYPFQMECARFALTRSRSYIGADPGTGKTIMAALIANALADHTVIYVCPPFLVSNVEDEFIKWTRRQIVRYADCRDFWEEAPQSVTLVPDTRLATDGRLERMFKSKRKLLFFVDEAHRFKSRETARTQALFRTLLPRHQRIVYLSGTPMPNRPSELFPVLNHSAPETIDFMGWNDFGDTYCGSETDRYGQDYIGDSNLRELAKRVKGTFMIRIRKEVVLKELPPKREALVFIGDEPPSEFLEMEQAILAKHSPEDLMRGVLGKEETEHIATHRRLLGIAKLPPAIEYIRHLLERGEAILVFAIHHQVITELSQAFKKFSPLTIDGSVANDERNMRVNAFQTDEKHRLVILNIKAGGIGFNITRAHRVVFVEFNWTPADNDQAIDRAHRIGQKNPVLAQYLVYRNSVDRKVMETVMRKKRVTAHI